MPMVTDWLMVVITAIYVGATIAIWFANNKSARMTEKQLEESRSQFEEAKRLECMPFLQLEIPTEQERPLFEIELDLCSGNVSDALYKIVRLKTSAMGPLRILSIPGSETKLAIKFVTIRQLMPSCMEIATISS